MTEAPLEFQVPPVQKAVVFPGPTEAAFHRLIVEIGAWWPLATHSPVRDPAAKLAFDVLSIGGRLVERLPDGEEIVWGKIISFKAPSQISFTWRPGREEGSAQLVEFTLSPIDSRRTLVKLVHSGWEKLGASAQAVRDQYDNGWPTVLGRYTHAAPA
jgi:uncharacterized protein YndB with AHSA1/START domain